VNFFSTIASFQELHFAARCDKSRENIFLLIKILRQPIRIFEISGHWNCLGEENACYHVKENKKLGKKLVSKVTLHFV